MKKFYLLFLTAVLCLSLTCSDNSTGPGQNTLISSENIGTSGGSIASDNFIVHIPSGALDSTTTVSLYKTTVVSPLDEHIVSEKLYIEGLPGTLGAPIDFYIKTDSTVGDSAWIGLGTLRYFVEGDSTGYAYTVVRADDSSGFLHCRIPSDGDPMPSAKRADYDTYSINPIYILFGLDDVWQQATTEHFVINYLAEFAGEIDPLKTTLEGIYMTLDYMHVDMDRLGRKFGVTLINIGGVYTMPSVFYRGEAVYIDINVGFNGADGPATPEVQSSIAGSMFRCILNLYLDLNKSKQYEWVRIAMDYWGKISYAGSSDNCGPHYDDNQIAPLYGIQPAMYDTDREKLAFAAGMVPLFKYLDNHQAYTIYNDVFGDMSYYNYHIYEAIDSNIAEPIYGWWTEFIKEHLSGEYCPIDAEKIINEKSGTFNIASANDTTATFAMQYYDLQSRVFFIGLNYDGFGDLDMLKFTLTGDENLDTNEMWVVLFKYKNNSLTFLGSGYNILYTPSIKTMYDNGESLVAVVVNAHYNRTYFYPDLVDINLKIDYVPETEASFNFVKVLFSVNPEYEDYDGTTYWGASDRSGFMAFNGSCVGGTFTGTVDPSWHGADADGSITLNFNPTTLEITSFNADITEYGTGYSIETTLEGANIPHTATYSWEECGVVGTQTCSHITSMGWFYIWDEANYKWTTLKSFSCDNDGHYLKVELWEK